MNLIKNLTVGKKIILSFGFLLLMVLLLGIFWQRDIVVLKEIEEKKSDLIELKEKLREMQMLHYKWVDALREAERTKGKFEAELDPKKCAFGEWYYSYKIPFPELEGLFNTLEEPHKKLHQSGVPVIKAIKEGNFMEADKIFLHTRRVLLPELMKVYDPFMKGIGDVYNKYKLESEKSVQRQRIISMVTAAFSLISATLLVILLTKGIVKPLRRVTDTAQKIAEGDIPDVPLERIREGSKNEIMQLEDSFIRMAVSLSELSKTAEQIASGDLTATVKIRSEKDVLAKAIAKMVENLKQSLEDLHTNSMNLAMGLTDYFFILQQVAVGNLTVSANENTGDDLLNQLGKVTNNMIAEYKKLDECVEEVGRGNLEAKVHIRSDKDVLGIGFEHMIEHLRKTSEDLHTSSMNLAMGLTDYFFILQQVAAGDLTVSANENTGDDLLDQLGRVTNSMISSLKDLTIKIREQADFLVSSASSMASVCKQSTRAISELSSSVSHMSSATSSVAESSRGASTAAQIADNSTQKGSDLMLKLAEKTKILQTATERSVAAMKGLSIRSSEIGNIVNVITDIASQTNLLSLNAAIVAAQAGEAGRAFAVVADEVRNLAESSAKFAKEIAEIIKVVQKETGGAMKSAEDSKKEMESGAVLIGEVSQQFSGIASQVENIVKLIENITASSEETATSALEASASSGEQSATMEEIAASAAQLSNTAEILKDTTAKFKLQ